MAMDIADNKVENLFNKLEAQRTILSTCTDLYKTLISQFTSIEQSITAKSEILDSRLQNLNSNSPKTLEDLQRREDSIPDRLSSFSSTIESQKQIALSEFEKPVPGDDAPLGEALKSVCRKMDHSGLLKLAVARRKESLVLRAELPNALNESVDPPRLLLDTVRDFVQQKAAKKGGLTDKRRACATVVVAMFPPEELVEKKAGSGSRPEFSKAMVEMAENVVREWREVAEKIAAKGGGGGGGGGGGDNGEGSSGMGPAEASMFLQIILGFGMKERFEEEFYRKMVVEFAARRDMPKLAIALFGDRIGDIIDELVENGKQVEAVYFATETGLTERFQPVPLLKDYLQNSKSNVRDILRKGNHNHGALDEANTYEMNSIKSIIKCVEDHNLESEFPLENLRKRLATLEKAKTDKKKALIAAPKPSNKRGYGSGAARNSGPPPPRPAKMTKFSGPYPSFGQRNLVAPAPPSAVSRYPPPYNNYPTYDAARTTVTYGASYGGPQIPPSAQATPQHYGVPGDGVGGVGGQLGGPYGGQAGYASYDYGAAAPHTYKPSSYA